MSDVEQGQESKNYESLFKFNHMDRTPTTHNTISSTNTSNLSSLSISDEVDRSTRLKVYLSDALFNDNQSDSKNNQTIKTLTNEASLHQYSTPTYLKSSVRDCNTSLNKMRSSSRNANYYHDPLDLNQLNIDSRLHVTDHSTRKYNQTGLNGNNNLMVTEHHRQQLDSYLKKFEKIYHNDQTKPKLASEF